MLKNECIGIVATGYTDLHGGINIAATPGLKEAIQIVSFNDVKASAGNKTISA